MVHGLHKIFKCGNEFAFHGNACISYLESRLPNAGPANMIYYNTPSLWAHIYCGPFEVCMYVQKCLHGDAPAYLHEQLKLYVRDEQLRPASLIELVIQHAKKKSGKAWLRCCWASCTEWSSPPIRTIDSIANFKKDFQSFLWHNAFTKIND